jgi:hypothetical protein
MVCRHCGTEIADKAIICFRCGAGTTEPVRRPQPVRKTRSPILSFVAIVLLVLIALYLGQASRTVEEPGMLQMVAAALVVIVAALLVIRVVRRR